MTASPERMDCCAKSSCSVRWHRTLEPLAKWRIGRDGVIEGEMVRAGEALEFGGERGRSERAGGENGNSIGVVLVESGDLFADYGDVGLGVDEFGDFCGKLDAVDGEGVAGGDGGGVGFGEEDTAGLAHLLLEEPGSGVFGLGLEGVGADELGEVGGLVGLGGARRAHLVEGDFGAEGCRLKGCLGASEASSDYLDFPRRQRATPFPTF